MNTVSFVPPMNHDLFTNLRLDVSGFQELAALLKGWTGIALGENPQGGAALMANRLAGLMGRFGIQSYREYSRLLRDLPAGAELRESFISALSIHTTSFFRHPHQFEPLRQAYLASKGSFRVWSAACSTGAEPYSIAMALDPLRHLVPGAFKVLASDIAEDVLQKGQSGQYTEKELEGVSDDLRRRYWSPVGGGTQWRAGASLKEKIVWAKFNLVKDEVHGLRNLDVIFCRNVLIYFDPATVHQVVAKLASSLKPGGLLILGAAEAGAVQQEGLERLGSAVFRKSEAPGS
jgi:chemotaxis methyl-accepting protein methylase